MITGSFDSAVGTVTVQIDAAPSSQNVEVHSIGELKYEFDLTPDRADIDALQALYNKVRVEIFTESFSGRDVFEDLVEKALADGKIDVLLTIASDPFPFYVTLNDIKNDEVSRIITLDCRVRYNDQVTVLDVFDFIEQERPELLDDFTPDAGTPSETIDCVGVADWISYAMKLIFGNDFSTVFESVPAGNGTGYTTMSYEGFIDGIPDGRVALIMARMTSPPFDGISTENALEDGVVFSRTNYNGAGQSFPDGFVLTWQGGNRFDELFDGRVLRPGDVLELIVPASGSSIFAEIHTILSGTNIRVTAATGNFSAGNYFWVNYRRKFRSSDVRALDALQELAGIEGSIYGSGFGRNFYFNRIQNHQIVDVDWNEVVEFASTPFYNPLGGGAVQHLPRTYSSVENTPGNSTLNEGPENFGVWPTTSGGWELPLITGGASFIPSRPEIDQELNIRLAPGYPFLNKALGDPSNSRFVGRYASPVSFHIDITPIRGLTRIGLISLTRALSGDGTGSAIEGRVFGAKSIKPWNAIQFQNAPAKYSGKLYRPTSLSYDLVGDMVSFECYQLNPDDIPINRYLVEAEGSVSVSGDVDVKKLNRYLVEAEGSVSVSGDVVVKKLNRYLVEVEGSVSVSGDVDVMKLPTALATPEGVVLTTPGGTILVIDQES